MFSFSRDKKSKNKMQYRRRRKEDTQSTRVNYPKKTNFGARMSSTLLLEFLSSFCK
jgi:hypothetical protein